MLVRARLAREDQFLGNKNHKTLWNSIRTELLNADIKVSVDQCLNKFKQIKRDWKACLDHNHKSGNDRKSCQFYDELNDIYGTKASTRPSFTMSTYGGMTTQRISPEDPTVQVSSDNESEDAQLADDFPVLVSKADARGSVKRSSRDDTEARPPKTSKSTVGTKKGVNRKRLAPEKSVGIEWLEGYEKRQTEYRKEQMECAREMHRDKCALMEKFLELSKSKEHE